MASTGTEAQYSKNFGFGFGGLLNSVVGQDIASAATIAPTHKFTRITGTTNIDTMTLPWDGFVGPLYLLADAAMAITTSGNFKKALTATADYVYGFMYDQTDGKWFQINVS